MDHRKDLQQQRKDNVITHNKDNVILFPAGKLITTVLNNLMHIIPMI